MIEGVTIADLLLGSGTIGAAFYCLVLSNRLKKFTDMESGIGQAIKNLSGQTAELTETLNVANTRAGQSTDTLQNITDRAEKVARNLELLVASMHDIPDTDDIKDKPEPDQGFISRRVISGGPKR